MFRPLLFARVQNAGILTLSVMRGKRGTASVVKSYAAAVAEATVSDHISASEGTSESQRQTTGRADD